MAASQIIIINAEPNGRPFNCSYATVYMRTGCVHQGLENLALSFRFFGRSSGFPHSSLRGRQKLSFPELKILAPPMHLWRPKFSIRGECSPYELLIGSIYTEYIYCIRTSKNIILWYIYGCLLTRIRGISPCLRYAYTFVEWKKDLKVSAVPKSAKLSEGSSSLIDVYHIIYHTVLTGGCRKIRAPSTKQREYSTSN